MNNTVKTPGFAVPGMAIAEQVASGMFALHEKLADDSWRTREAAEFPTSDGKGVYIPLQRLLWPATGMPVDYESDSSLFTQLGEFFKHHLLLREEKAYDIIDSFDFMTYRQEEFSTVPYLNILGPKDTGKTRLDELLAATCYRGWLVTHPTPASVFYMIDRYRPTLICDNYEYWPREARMELDGLLCAGYRRGAIVPRRPRDESSSNELEVYNTFCPKTISGTRVLAGALDSRCIRIRTAKAIGDLPMFVDDKWATELRAKLLTYRFRHFENPLHVDERVTNRYSRVGEIFYALLNVAPNDAVRKTIADYALGVFNEEVEEQATGIEADIVKAIVESVPLAVAGKLAQCNILDKLNQTRRTEDQVSPRSLGWILKRLGFPKARFGNKKATRAIELDLALLEHLARTYDVSYESVEDLAGQVQSEPTKSLITSYTRTHIQEESVPSDSDSVDEVIGVGYLSMAPAQRLRVKRLKWLFAHIKQNPGKMTEELRQLVMSRFGLAFRTSGEYLRVLAGAHLVVCFYGRWMTRKAYLNDPYWNSHATDSADNQGDSISRKSD